jgi:hypothetical protein
METVAGLRSTFSFRPTSAVRPLRELDERSQDPPVAVLLQGVLGELAREDLVDTLAPVEGPLARLDDGELQCVAEAARPGPAPGAARQN